MRKLSLLLLLLMLQLAMYGRGNTPPSLSQSPLSFIENKGQIRDQHGNPRTDIDFILQSKSMVLYIGKGQLHYQFIKENPKDTTHYTRANPPKHYQVGPGYTTYRLDVSLQGANVSAEALKEGAQETKYHYYNNNKPEGITGVQSFSRITYKDIYPGIDWVLYTKNGHLKYDFVVHPGAKPGDIKLNYAGATAMALAEDGSLQITTPLANLKEEAPYSYEQGTKKVVASHYLLNDNTLSLSTGAYKGTLVIDPGVEWATYFGGNAFDGCSGNNIAYASEGYIYLSGITSSLADLATTGAHQTNLGGGLYDAFLAKFDTSGQLQWATYYGGEGLIDSSSDYIYLNSLRGREMTASVTCDGFGNVYLAGKTYSATGIATPGSYQDTGSSVNSETGYDGGYNGFLVKFNSVGIRQWGTYYGGSTSAMAFTSVACDPDGNVYAAGYADSSFSTTGALVTPGAHQTVFSASPVPPSWFPGFTPAGPINFDGLLVKFDSSGTRQWATYYGDINPLYSEINPFSPPPSSSKILDVICDDEGNVYITGSGPGGSVTQGTHQSEQTEHVSGFLSKFGPDGTQLWGSYLNAPSNSLFLDPFQHLYIAGTIMNQQGADSMIVTEGCYQPNTISGSTNGSSDGFLMQMNASDGTRNWGTYYGAEGRTSIYDVTADYQGNVYITGNTNSYGDLYSIATPGSYKDTFTAGSSVQNDAFVVQFDSSGIRKWATYYGDTAEDNGNGLAVDPSGAIYLVGQTTSAAAIATANSHQDTLNGIGDAFLVRWLPVDISIKREAPAADTVCTGEVPLTVSVSNLGRMDKTDDLVITYAYTGPTEGSDTFTFTGGLPAGAVESYSLGAVSLDYEAVYDFTIYLHYTQDDNEINNDTLHFSLTTTTAEPVANIEYSQIGTNYQFSNPDGLSSYTYHWDFGDGDTSNEATPTHSYELDGTYDVTLIVTGWCGSDTAHLSLDAVGTGTGVSGISNDNLLTVYPNPAKGDLYLKANGITMKRYEVVNVLGQTMLNGILNGQQDKINVSGLAAGSYYIRIETNKGMAEKPFQVIR